MSYRKNVTLKEVADKSGVSIATVSRVLNKSGYVSPNISRNVRAAVKKLGYFQNFTARSLKTNSTNMIALVTADISNPYMITVAKAIENLIQEQNYNLLVCSTEGDPEREFAHLNMQMSRNVDGIVINATGFNEELIERVSNRIPLVLVHRKYHIPGFTGDFVDSDNETGTYGLTKHLLSFGHRNIFIIKGSKHASTNTYRLKGFVNAMAEVGIDVNDSYPFQFDGNFSEESGYRAVEYLQTLATRPTAILGLNNTMTVGALRALLANNITVPDQMSVVSYNDIDYKELMTIRPTLHAINPAEIGKLAGKALLERLANNKLPNREFILDGHMIPGNTVSIPALE